MISAAARVFPAGTGFQTFPQFREFLLKIPQLRATRAFPRPIFDIVVISAAGDRGGDERWQAGIGAGRFCASKASCM